MNSPRFSLYALLVATHAADVATTRLGLSAGLVENNPASAALLALGFPVWVAVKALVLAAIGLVGEFQSLRLDGRRVPCPRERTRG